MKKSKSLPTQSPASASSGGEALTGSFGESVGENVIKDAGQSSTSGGGVLAVVGSGSLPSKSPTPSGLDELPKEIALALIWLPIKQMVLRKEAVLFKHKSTDTIWVGLLAVQMSDGGIVPTERDGRK